MNIAIGELRYYLPPGKQIAADLYGVEWRGNRARCLRAENHVHGDSDPSFVYLEKEHRFHCYSQQCFGEKAIDVFDLVGQMENLSVSGAVTRLTQQYAPQLISNGHKQKAVPKLRVNTDRLRASRPSRKTDGARSKVRRLHRSQMARIQG